METRRLIQANVQVEFRRGGDLREISKLISNVAKSLDSTIVDHCPRLSRLVRFFLP